MQHKENYKLTDHISWVGALDFDIVTFDIVMETKYGTTYNAYLVNAEQPAVIETVKSKFWDVFKSNLEQKIDLRKIKYIVADHTEPDHSGCVPHLLALAPEAKVVGSGNAIRYLREQIGHDFPHIQVKDGDVIDLGGRTLRFISAPNLHWPDSIYTYCPEEKVLFTCDSFGAHYCDERIFDDLVGSYDDAFKYYFDVILKHFSKFMLQAIEKIRGLDIAVIAPGHGPVLRKTWRERVDECERLSREALGKPIQGTILIAYVSAYNNTGKIAQAVADGARSVDGALVRLCDLEKTPLNELAGHIEDAAGYIIGSPVINQNILLQIYRVFALMNPIRDRNKLAASFGSFGWSGEGSKIIESNLTNLKLKVFDKNLFFKFTPHEELLQQARNLGKSFAEALLKAEQ
ncbi:MAG: FprA family A-type flavoprotein [Bacteroidetes bacterium]|nr:FprA family A-type flavoprotein [Bacteroidota bacterium]